MTSVLSGGMIRNAPSRKPTYQSGWEPVDTAAGWYGPYSQIGLICANVASAVSTAMANIRNAVVCSANLG